MTYFFPPTAFHDNRTAITLGLRYHSHILNDFFASLTFISVSSSLLFGLIGINSPLPRARNFLGQAHPHSYDPVGWQSRKLHSMYRTVCLLVFYLSRTVPLFSGFPFTFAHFHQTWNWQSWALLFFKHRFPCKEIKVSWALRDFYQKDKQERGLKEDVGNRCLCVHKGLNNLSLAPQCFLNLMRCFFSLYLNC